MGERLKIVHLEDHRIYQRAVQRSADPENKKYLFQSFQDPRPALLYIENALKNRSKIDLIITNFTQVLSTGCHFASSVRNLESDYNIQIPILLISLLKKDQRYFKRICRKPF